MADTCVQALLGSGLTVLSHPLVYIKVLIQVSENVFRKAKMTFLKRLNHRSLALNRLSQITTEGTMKLLRIWSLVLHVLVVIIVAAPLVRCNRQLFELKHCINISPTNKGKHVLLFILLSQWPSASKPVVPEVRWTNVRLMFTRSPKHDKIHARLMWLLPKHLLVRN